ncbi:MAG: universal stress protein [Pigmentiphaga sp.]
MPIKTIVVALALDDDSKRVAGRAVQLANQHQAQLVGVHVLENLPFLNQAGPTGRHD